MYKPGTRPDNLIKTMTSTEDVTVTEEQKSEEMIQTSAKTHKEPEQKAN